MFISRYDFGKGRVSQPGISVIVKMNKLLIYIAVIWSVNFCLIPGTSFCQSTSLHTRINKLNNGVLLVTGEKRLKIEFISPEIVHVRFVPSGDFKSNGTDMCVPRNARAVAFRSTENPNQITLQSKALRLVISKSTGSIRYSDAAGNLLLAENPDSPRVMAAVKLSKATFNDAVSHVVKTANGDQASAAIRLRETIGTAWSARQQFVWQKGEALYGLGSHQEDYMNLRGTRQYLYEYNLKKSLPVLMSTKGYGLLFDGGSAMVFHDDTVGSFMKMLAVNQVDYYFMYGPGFDRIVSGFRSLTGKVELPPKYMFGYVQSKERYTNPHEIDSVVTRFRTSHIPLDLIVQDWQYWKNGLWGHKKFDETKYPHPDKMIDSVHSQNAHFMLSIWPQMAANEETEMSEKGFILGRRIYNAYDAAARKMYWDNYVGKNLFTKGVDAWWCDSSEPVEADWNRGANSIANNPEIRFEKNVKVMADLLGDMRVNTFSLHHTEGIYENQRKSESQKRVVILTRASFPGQQRYGTMVWNGDTKATWADFKSWIPAGLNYMVTGSPYWTIDAGAFFVSTHPEWFGKGEFPKGTADPGYREFYVRNIQYAGWLPLFRSHGTDFAREPWQFGAPGGMFYDAIIKQINLRYRLLPYIYSLAARVTNEDFTMTRSLLFDFRTDTKVYNIKDEFMFGNEFLICPVTQPMYYNPNEVQLNNVNKSREVYLPAHTTWFDFWTGKRYAGGHQINAEAPIDHIPVFVKAGSVIPMGPVTQYAADRPDAKWEVRIFPGANGTFTVYEDEGDSYNYQKGASATFKITWDDKTHTVTISDRKGHFNGLAKSRALEFILVSPGKGQGVEESTGKTITYEGKSKQVSL